MTVQYLALHERGVTIRPVVGRQPPQYQPFLRGRSSLLKMGCIQPTPKCKLLYTLGGKLHQVYSYTILV